jgi:TRAP-type mannitol/chloroaromatic compound transport system permease large subunit
MKLPDFLLLSLSAALIIIGTHLTITSGLISSYPVFMFAVALLFWFRYRKNEATIKSEEEKQVQVKKVKSRKSK